MGYRIETNGLLGRNARLYFNDMDVSEGVISAQIVISADETVKAIITVTPEKINGKTVWDTNTRKIEKRVDGSCEMEKVETLVD